MDDVIDLTSDAEEEQGAAVARKPPPPPAAAAAAASRRTTAADDANDSDSDSDIEVITAPNVATNLKSDETEQEDDEDTKMKGGDDDDIQVVGMKGHNAMMDFPHARKDCVVHPWNNNNAGSSSKEKFCKNCYCYVCDIPAKDCKSWSSSSSGGGDGNHCEASNAERKWRLARETKRSEATGEPIRRDVVDPHGYYPGSSYGGNSSDDEDDEGGDSFSSDLARMMLMGGLVGGPPSRNAFAHYLLSHIVSSRRSGSSGSNRRRRRGAEGSTSAAAISGLRASGGKSARAQLRERTAMDRMKQLVRDTDVAVLSQRTAHQFPLLTPDIHLVQKSWTSFKDHVSVKYGTGRWSVKRRVATSQDISDAGPTASMYARRGRVYVVTAVYYARTPAIAAAAAALKVRLSNENSTTTSSSNTTSSGAASASRTSTATTTASSSTARRASTTTTTAAASRKAPPPASSTASSSLSVLPFEVRNFLQGRYNLTTGQGLLQLNTEDVARAYRTHLMAVQAASNQSPSGIAFPNVCRMVEGWKQTIRSAPAGASSTTR